MPSSDNVIQLSDHRKDPHMAGTAVCAACRYEWVQVAPQGTEWLTCPECASNRGHFKNAAIPDGCGTMCCGICGGTSFGVFRHDESREVIILCHGCGQHMGNPYEAADAI